MFPSHDRAGEQKGVAIYSCPKRFYVFNVVYIDSVTGAEKEINLKAIDFSKTEHISLITEYFNFDIDLDFNKSVQDIVDQLQPYV